MLVFTALAVATKYGAPSIYNAGPQGFSETLYAYTSQGNNNGSAFAGYTGFVQPNAPGNVGAFGITFADLLGGVTMLAARFVPLLAALAVAGSLATKRVAPLGPGHVPHGHAHVRGPAHLRDRPRRRAHLLPRPPARPGRPGPDHPALLTPCAETSSHPIIAIVVLTVALRGGLSAGHDRRGPGAVPQQGGRQPDRARRQGRRLAPDRPGLREAGARPNGKPKQDADGNPVLEADLRYFQSRPSATGYSANVTFFNNLGPNSKDLSDLFEENLAAYLKRERPYNPGLRRRRRAARRRAPPRPPASTRTSRRPTRASRRAASPRCAA